MNTLNLIRENNRLYDKLSAAETRAYMAELKYDSAISAMEMMARVIEEMAPAHIAARKSEMLKQAWTAARGKSEFANWAFLWRFTVEADGLKYAVRPQARGRRKNRVTNYDGETGNEISWVVTSTALAQISFRLPVHGLIYLNGTVIHTETYEVASGRHEFVNEVLFDLDLNGKNQVVRIETRGMAHELLGLAVCQHPGETWVTLNPSHPCARHNHWHGDAEYVGVVNLTA